MGKKKNYTKEEILSLYMDFVTDHKAKPLDIENFCSQVSITEETFYKYFKNLKKIEKSIFKAFFTNSIDVLHESEEFLSFDNKNLS